MRREKILRGLQAVAHESGQTVGDPLSEGIVTEAIGGIHKLNGLGRPTPSSVQQGAGRGHSCSCRISGVHADLCEGRNRKSGVRPGKCLDLLERADR